MSPKEPQHIAIIMDGNGRWARSKKHNRVFGHTKGAKVARDIVISCAEQKIKNLTLFTFSTENWLRPKDEVNFLMRLLARQLYREKLMLIENNIRFHVIGDISALPAPTRAAVIDVVSATAHLSGMNLTFAINYGGRQEITEACKKIATQVQAGSLTPENINETLFSNHLASQFLPDPDLIIRTSGEFRLSNFFLWQSAYSEIYITPVLWPDFTKAHLDRALQFFSERVRRFGKVIEPELIQNNPKPLTL